MKYKYFYITLKFKKKNYHIYKQAFLVKHEIQEIIYEQLFQ